MYRIKQNLIKLESEIQDFGYFVKPLSCSNAKMNTHFELIDSIGDKFEFIATPFVTLYKIDILIQNLDMLLKNMKVIYNEWEEFQIKYNRQDNLPTIGRKNFEELIGNINRKNFDKLLK